MAVPRGGGLAVVLVILAGFLYLSLLVNGDFLYIWPILAGVLLLAAVSWLDDLKNLHIKWRLPAQFIAVAAGLYAVHPMAGNFPVFIPLWLGIAALLVGWIWFINLYNFMDGIDGITGMESISIAMGIAMVTVINYQLPQEIEFYASVIGAAALGFLLWNWPPARIFMGDVGSIPLGFILGWLLIEIALRGHWAEALLIPAYYLADSGYTISKRLCEKKKIWQAHSEHFYQQAVRGGKSHGKTVTMIIALNIILLGLAAAAGFYPMGKLLFLAIGYGLTALLMLYFHRVVYE